MSKQDSISGNQIVKFLRKRDYQFVRELGQGACGRTVLLYDEQIDQHYVCKKYTPYDENCREQLFANFVSEIKLLHDLQHENVVRVFHHYLYPDDFWGFILMEYVEGSDIQDFVALQPEKTNDLFLQAINGFAYLESKSILHRDIRVPNLLVHDDGTLKIIDLGFGKHIHDSEDFDKSISLNMWCEKPAEFADGRYDFGTEVYFVGKLFKKLIDENNISDFKYTSALGQMCRHAPSQRIKSFADVGKEIRSDQFVELEFSSTDLNTYREFSSALCSCISRIESGVKYVTDVDRVIKSLEMVYRGSMLETNVSNAVTVVRCFLTSSYYGDKNAIIKVELVRSFLRFFKSTTEEKQRIMLANLYTKLDAIPTVDKRMPTDDDIPF